MEILKDEKERKIREEFLKEMEKKEKIIVIDFDEVIVNIADKWKNKIKDNFHLFESCFCSDRINNTTEINNRDEFYLDKYLLKNEKIKDETFNNFFKIYDNTEFYHDVKPTLFITRLVEKMNLKSGQHKVIVLSKTLDNHIDIKEKISKELLGENTIFIPVPMDKSKSEVLNNQFPDMKIDLFIDDQISNIMDIIKNCKYTILSVLCPKFGYNQLSEKDRTYILSLYPIVQFSYYEEKETKE